MLSSLLLLLAQVTTPQIQTPPLTAATAPALPARFWKQDLADLLRRTE